MRKCAPILRIWHHIFQSCTWIYSVCLYTVGLEWQIFFSICLYFINNHSCIYSQTKQYFKKKSEYTIVLASSSKDIQSSFFIRPDLKPCCKCCTFLSPCQVCIHSLGVWPNQFMPPLNTNYQIVANWLFRVRNTDVFPLRFGGVCLRIYFPTETESLVSLKCTGKPAKGRV